MFRTGWSWPHLHDRGPTNSAVSILIPLLSSQFLAKTTAAHNSPEVDGLEADRAVPHALEPALLRGGLGTLPAAALLLAKLGAEAGRAREAAARLAGELLVEERPRGGADEVGRGRHGGDGGGGGGVGGGNDRSRRRRIVVGEYGRGTGEFVA